jgi:RND family efflux transporter MFP subunit
MDSPYPHNTEKHKSPWLSYVIGVIVLLILFVVGYLPKYRNSHELDSQVTNVAEAPPEVAVIYPRMAAPEPLNLPGNIEAVSTTSVQARTTGYVEKLYVDIGSRVKAGQVLADIQSPDVDQQLAQAGSQVEQSKATVTQSQSEVQRLVAAVAQSRADILHQKAGIAQAEAAVESAAARKSQAQAGLMVAKAALLRSQEQVNVQNAALTQAEAQYALASASLKRYAALLAKGFVSQQDYDQAQATYRTQGATISSAKANIAAAVADVKAAEETIKSNEDLVASAEADRRSAIANVKAADANLASSQASLEAAQSSVNSGRYTVAANQAAVGASQANRQRYNVLTSFEHVTAPFPGIITTRNVDVGSLVSPGTTAPSDASSTTPNTGLFGIARDDTLRIYVDIPQTDYALAKPGTVATIKVRELPRYSFAGTVRQSSGAISESTRTVQTEIRVPNPNDLLLPGMYAMVDFSSGSEKELRVPADALIIDGKGTRVVVVDPQGKIHYRLVTLGRDYGTESAVINGLKLGDRLVANPTDDLTEGEKVTVAKNPPGGTANGGATAGGTGAGGAHTSGTENGGAGNGGKKSS